MIKPLVSIIIPTYNRAHLISETLDSILRQTYQNWECIIVDDGSTDTTEETISVFSKKNPSIKFYKRPDNLPKGPSACRNYGFHFAKGDLIHFMDSDDLYLPNALENYKNSFSESIDVVVAKLELINFESGLRIRENNILTDNLIEDYFVGAVAFYVSGPVWKKSFLMKQEQLFDENISNLDDWDFNLRMLYQNPKLQILDIPLVQYRINEKSLSHEIAKLNFKEVKSELSTRQKHLCILKQNREVNSSKLKSFVMDRHRYFLKRALELNNENKYFFFYNLQKQQLKCFHLIGFIKVFFVFFSCIVFNKGYKFLK
jgi:glycosyltransferase involved in cell wall biosynthesis